MQVGKCTAFGHKAIMPYLTDPNFEAMASSDSGALETYVCKRAQLGVELILLLR